MIFSVFRFFFTLPFRLVKVLCSILPFWGSPVFAGLIGWGVYDGLESHAFAAFDLNESILISVSLSSAIAIMVFMYGLQGYLPVRRKRSIMRKAVNLEKLQALSWEDFEIFVSQAYEQAGYKVKAAGGFQADGGIDVEAHSKRDGHIVIQCKHWSQPVGVKIVRETLGVMHKMGADKAVVVASGKFTRDAVAFAVGQPVELIDGETLLEFVGV